MKTKWKRLVSAGVVLLAVIGATAFQATDEKKTILEFGMFTGSNWGVKNADAFVMIDRAIARFEEGHPGVKVKYTSGIDREDYTEWCAEKLLKGDMPDVFMVLDEDFSRYMSLHVLEDLDPYMENDPKFHRSVFFSTALEIGQGIEEGKTQYALPYEVVPTMLFVNKTLLKKERIQMPSKYWNWEEFYDICRKITKDTDGDGRLDQFGTYNYTWLDAMYTSGGTAFDSKNRTVDFTSPGVIESVKFMKRLHQLYGGEIVTQEDFDAGKVAFMPLNFAEYRTYKTYPYKIKKYTNFQWDCTTFPGIRAGQNVSKVDALLLGISRDSDKKELAWEFLKELTTGDNSQMDIFRYSQGVSSLKKIAGSKEAEEMIQGEMDPEEQVIGGEFLCEVIENGEITPKFYRDQMYEQIVSLANTGITNIFDQNKSVDSSMKILQRELQQYISQ
ncbi:ABC transporter substrate-binding protein [Clostridium sp. C105KSO13]|uniref:ABC transporter substrate-binding protein n=1 Tax=Clostridium sp. C105KSO13 TaxID=1776045 RepID=UPI0007406CC4|nr:extracellular solute-binding protein [Clostridium sp. C105KSO13]CUX37804.1 maltose ABC transporter periplasmic protein [Clostridium sp. C105KSO13]